MLVSIIIVSYNTSAILRECLTSLLKNSGSVELEIFVVDNDSRDDSVEMIKKFFPMVHLLTNKTNLGFAAANNQAFNLSKGDYVLLLNPDAFVKPDAIDNALKFMESMSECGLCGGRLVKPDGSLDPSARRFPNFVYKFFTISGLSSKFPRSRIFGRYDFTYFDHNSVMEVDWVPGTFTLYRRSMLDRLGLFDERYFLYYEETDLCLRAKRAGWKVYFIPNAEVVHVGGASSKTKKDEVFDTAGSQVLKFRMRSELLYFRKNYGLFSALANTGVEIAWHLLRYIVNWIPGKANARQKRLQSANIIHNALKAIKDTKLGRLSPERPW